MKEVELRVRIDVRLDWLKPPASDHEKMLRAQAEIQYKSVAPMLEEVVELLVAKLARERYGVRERDVRDDITPAEPRDMTNVTGITERERYGINQLDGPGGPRPRSQS